MRDYTSVNVSCGYVLTQSGKEAITDTARCDCVPQFCGGLLQCPSCGTVYALLREQLVSNGTAFNAKQL